MLGSIKGGEIKPCCEQKGPFSCYHNFLPRKMRDYFDSVNCWSFSQSSYFYVVKNSKSWRNISGSINHKCPRIEWKKTGKVMVNGMQFPSLSSDSFYHHLHSLVLILHFTSLLPVDGPCCGCWRLQNLCLLCCAWTLLCAPEGPWVVSVQLPVKAFLQKEEET